MINTSNLTYSSLSIYQKIQVFSIDVVLGALASGAFASKILNVNPPFAWWFILPIAVWVIYTTDHLLDAQKNKSGSHTIRHQIHYLYRNNLWPIVIVLGLLNLGLAIIYFSKQTLIFGLIIALIALIYFININAFKKSYFYKEWWIALIYTSGVWGVPLLYAYPNIDTSSVIMLFLFAVLVWIDMIIISVYEIKSDQADKHLSFATQSGIKKTNKIVILFLLLSAIGGMILIIISSSIMEIYAAITLMTISLQLYFLHEYKIELNQHEYYRRFSELIFILPFLIFCIIFI